MFSYSNLQIQWSALHQLVLKGNEQDIIAAIEKGGMDVGVIDSEGATPLHWVSHRGPKETVELLLNKKANPNIKDDVRKLYLFGSTINSHAYS